MSKNLLACFIGLLLVFGVSQTAKACHGVALVNFSTTLGPNSITVNGSSDPATCGCGPYYMEVELACFSAANFTGNAPTCTATNWNIYPWYRSILNVPNYTAAAGWPDNCVVEPYNPVTIPFANLCPGTTYVLRARERVCGSGSGGPWSPTVTFTTPGVAPNFTLSATTNPNPASVCPNQPVTITAVINGSGGCGSGTPTFTLNPGNITNTTGVFTVTPAVSTTYTITAAGGYLLCYPCAPVTVPVTINQPPTVGTASLTPPVVCQGSCVTLNLTSYTVGTLQWQQSPNGVTGWTNIPGATTNPYVFCPVNGPLYFRAMISNPCNPAAPLYSNVINVGITPTPNVNITPANPSICVGQSVTLNGSGSPNTYNWSGPNGYAAVTQNVTVSPTVTTTYTLQTAPGNCPGIDSVTVVVNPLPVIAFAPPAASLCAGDDVDVDAGTNLNSYVWSPMTGVTPLSASQDSVNLAPLTTTTYNVTSTSPQGCSSMAQFTLTINPNPVLVLSDDSLTICVTSTDTVFMQGAANYVWSPPNGGYNQLTANGDQVEFLAVAATYTVIGTSAAGCADTAEVYVTVSSNIIVSAGADDTICPNVVTQLTGSGATNYTWTASNATVITNGNTATPTVAPVTTTDFYLHGTNQFGCFGDDTVTLFVRNLPVANAGPDVTICQGDSATLNGSGGVGFQWAGNNITSGANTSTPVVTPVQTTDYVLTITDQFGCTDEDTVVVSMSPTPQINAGPDAYICGTGTTLTASGGQNYQWSPVAGLGSPNSATTTANPVTTTTYVVVSQDANGCESSDSLIVTVYPPLAVQVSAADSICPGGAAPVSAQGSGGDGGQYTYSWSPAAGLANPNAAMTSASPAQTTTYVVTVSDACGSPVVTNSIVITVLPLPVLNVTPSVFSGCEDLCVDFTAVSVPAAASWTYDFGDMTTSSALNPQNCYETPGLYDITFAVTDVYGCQNSITYPNMIEVFPTPIPGFTASPQTTTILNPVISISPNCINCDTTYYWMGDPGDSQVDNLALPFNWTYDTTGTFWIVQYVVSQNGCFAWDSQYVYIEPDFSFYAPNAFTPNGDNMNDEFRVYGEGIDFSTFEMYVFDRWGNLIYTTDDINRGWDGRRNGGPMSQIDTYVWQVRFKDQMGNPHKYVGHINLIL